MPTGVNRQNVIEPSKASKTVLVVTLHYMLHFATFATSHSYTSLPLLPKVDKIFVRLNSILSCLLFSFIVQGFIVYIFKLPLQIFLHQTTAANLPLLRFRHNLYCTAEIPPKTLRHRRGFCRLDLSFACLPPLRWSSVPP